VSLVSFKQMSSPSYNYTSWFSNERTIGLGLFVYSTRTGLPQVRHTRNFSIEFRAYIGGHDLGFPEILSAIARVCARRLCRSANQTTLLYFIRIHSSIYSGQRFLLPFFVSAPETAQRIQGPLTTRVIIGPGLVAAAASELRVSARPLPRNNPINIIYIYIYIYV